MINDRLHELKQELNPDFPLSEGESRQLFLSIQSSLKSIYTNEKKALSMLVESV